MDNVVCDVESQGRKIARDWLSGSIPTRLETPYQRGLQHIQRVSLGEDARVVVIVGPKWQGKLLDRVPECDRPYLVNVEQHVCEHIAALADEVLSQPMPHARR